MQAKKSVKLTKSLLTKKNFKLKDKLAKQLPTKTIRNTVVREVVKAPLTRVQRKTEAKAIDKAVKRDFRWTEQANKAAYLLAEDRMPDKDIAFKVGVEEGVLRRWNKHPQFLEVVHEYTVKWKERVMNSGICVKENRLNILNKLKRSLVSVVDKRADKYKNRTVPGVSEGIMIRRVKAVGHGAKTKVVRQWEIDTDLIDRILAIDQQAAKETGQWKDITENRNTVLVREYEGASPDDV